MESQGGGFLDDILNANFGSHWIGVGFFHLKEKWSY